MKKITPALLILAIVAVAAFAVSMTLLVYYKNVILKTDTILMDITVGDHVGLNVNNSAMHFGMATPGGTATRFMNFENKYPFDLKIAFQTYGFMAPWVRVSNASLVLMPDETAKVTFDTKIPKGTPYGNYTGNLTIIFKRS